MHNPAGCRHAPTESRAAAAAARWLWAEERQCVLSPCLWILPQQLLSHLHKLQRNTADMVLHSKEFSTAGKTAGLQIWRIENMEIVPVPESLHGNFYTGDAYVILYTVKQKDNSFYHLHFWLGKRTCSQLLTGVVLQRHQCPRVSLFRPKCGFLTLSVTCLSLFHVKLFFCINVTEIFASGTNY